MCCCTEWIHGHARRLVAVARHEGLSPTDALDAVQDAYHTFLQRADARELPAEDAHRLLATITRNAARNLRRRHHRAMPHVGAERLVANDRPDEAAARAEVAQQLVTCMGQLGATHREVITLRVLEELSGHEAADVLGISTNHVAVLLHRARKELERCMLTAR